MNSVRLRSTTCLRLQVYVNVLHSSAPFSRMKSGMIVGVLTLVASVLADNVPPTCDCSAIPTKRLMCGNDGKNYTDSCAYVSAKFSNPNLGFRPCAQMSDPVSFAEWMKSMHSGPSLDPAAAEAMRTSQRTACLTNGQNAVGTMHAINEQVQTTSADLGVRCMKPCPCPTDVCPHA